MGIYSLDALVRDQREFLPAPCIGSFCAGLIDSLYSLSVRGNRRCKEQQHMDEIVSVKKSNVTHEACC